MFKMRSEILVLKIRFFCTKYDFLDVKIQIFVFQSWQVYSRSSMVEDAITQTILGGLVSLFYIYGTITHGWSTWCVK